MQTTLQLETSEQSFWGAPISIYTRAQAIEDGQLVDLSDLVQPCPFKFPVAMTIGAYNATMAAGGRWVPDADGETLVLPGGQDTVGRGWDVFNVMLHQLRRGKGGSRLDFSVLIDVHGNGRPHPVKLYSLCGPGDNGEPVITIMLPNED